MKAMMFSRSALAWIALAAVVVASGCSGKTATGTLAQARKDASIYIGVIPFEAPLLFQKNQEMVGPEAELANKIAELVGNEVGVEVGPFWLRREGYAALAPALAADELDFVVSAYGVSEEREKTIAFSKSYYKSELMMVVNPALGEGLDPSGFAGQTIALRAGTIAAEKVKAKFPDAQFLEVDTVDNGVLAVRRGEAAAVIDDRYMLAYSLATLSGAQRLELIDEVIDTVDFAVAVRQTETRVRELVNQAVDEMMGQTYITSLQGQFSDQDYQAVILRRERRKLAEAQAKKPRFLTIRVLRAAGSDFDIYRFANLRFRLTDSSKGKSYNSTLINFQGRVGVCTARVEPGNYKLVLQKFNFSPGNVVITPTDKDRVTVNVTAQADGSFRMTRGD